MTYPVPGALERIGAEWDWVWIDTQHGQFGYQDMLAMVRACNLVQRPAIVRVPGHDSDVIGLALDTGADGVMVPLVDTLEQARNAVRAAKFPPLGNRSYGGRRPVDLLGRTYAETANTDTMLVVQIESPEAVGNADAIAATPGVDALLLGPNDILLRHGRPATTPLTKETLGHDLEAVAAACRRHGKIAATTGMRGETFTFCVNLGYRMLAIGNDAAFLAATSKQASAEARELLKSLLRPGSPC
ncbi:MAG: hypothetical protein A3K19_19775 [Lentisphaerae bacterium RIFOXYB12_FULL_65_16]|nr:MAG: hypothetical protein A3K18_07575 [Lentisphaerae bacterium RIFOXYA12_64_32]OGV85048.1 MAG: hypothetical protein A3K19_19775 [Lentisphaerae bacterium RIFOXYB12_FULL_65_16]